MALAQTSLGNVIHIAAGAAASVYTVASGQTTYIRSFLVHSLDASSTSNVKIHVVPNNGGNPGTATSNNQIARLGISTEDTYFFECAYPITLTSNGDTVQVNNENTNQPINVLVLGDREG